jgi:hypothetical protein
MVNTDKLIAEAERLNYGYAENDSDNEPLAWDEKAQAYWRVNGPQVVLGDGQSIQDAIDILSFYLHACGVALPVPTARDLPGPRKGLGGDGVNYVGD